MILWFYEEGLEELRLYFNLSRRGAGGPSRPSPACSAAWEGAEAAGPGRAAQRGLRLPPPGGGRQRQAGEPGRACALGVFWLNSAVRGTAFARRGVAASSFPPAPLPPRAVPRERPRGAAEGRGPGRGGWRRRRQGEARRGCECGWSGSREVFQERLDLGRSRRYGWPRVPAHGHKFAA